MQKQLDTIADLMARARAWHLREFKPHPELGKYQVPTAYFTSEHKFALDTVANWDGCPLEFYDYYKSLQKRLRAMNIPVYANACYRSPQMQAALHRRGWATVSTDGPHQRACCIDLFHNHFLRNCDERFWTFLNRIAVDEARKHYIAAPQRNGGFKRQRMQVEVNGHWSIRLKGWQDWPKVIPSEWVTEE